MLKRNKTTVYVIATLVIGLTIGMAINPKESKEKEVVKGTTIYSVFEIAPYEGELNGN